MFPWYAQCVSSVTASTLGPPTASGVAQHSTGAFAGPWEPGTGCPRRPPFTIPAPRATGMVWAPRPVLEGMEGVLALELVKLAVRPRSHSRVRSGVGEKGKSVGCTVQRQRPALLWPACRSTRTSRLRVAGDATSFMSPLMCMCARPYMWKEGVGIYQALLCQTITFE